MLRFDVISKLGLTLDAGKGTCLVQSDGMRSVQDRIASLDEEQVELDRITRVHVSIREKIFAAQQHRLGLVDPLLPQRLRMIHPIDCTGHVPNMKIKDENRETIKCRKSDRDVGNASR